MVWAQVFPFVALQSFEGELKSEIEAGLIVSFTIWVALNIAFFCTIDLAYLPTFFGTMTGESHAPRNRLPLFRFRNIGVLRKLSLASNTSFTV